ncbi:O-methyltransferase [Rhodopseudomonas palustris]|uniref:O-methyltransferase n=1 Tax=Rhodopseudomonas palustris TaxID=1076 RepID=UPI000D1A660A|nr:class I SAM-dependent methyltransferase [Rhodopseudomonas palustris]AVT77501.1 O-methyltransferase [Rhodopseudomonas palustris]
MTTLTTSPLAPLLTRLFDEAEATQPQLDQLAPDTMRLMRSKTDYATLYGRLKDYALAVSPETGVLLYMLARGCRARSIVEFGTSFGISTLHLAAALRDNGGGRLITTEFEHAKLVRAEANLEAGDLADLVEFREGDALQTLSKDLPDRIDLVLLDGAKALYADILDRLESRLSPGALIVADNADHCPDYLARVRDSANGYLSVPFAADVELSMRLG